MKQLTHVCDNCGAGMTGDHWAGVVPSWLADTAWNLAEGDYCSACLRRWVMGESAKFYAADDLLGTAVCYLPERLTESIETAAEESRLTLDWVEGRVSA